MTSYDEWLNGNAGRDPYEDDSMVEPSLEIDPTALAAVEEWAQGEPMAQDLGGVLALRYDAWMAQLKTEIARLTAAKAECPF